MSVGGFLMMLALGALYIAPWIIGAMFLRTVWNILGTVAKSLDDDHR